MGGLGPVVAPQAVKNLSKFREVRKYRTDRSVRHAVWRSVLETFPTEGRVIVIAHSLGSVIAVDLISRLPPDLTVDLLITVGSPLASHLFGVETARLNERFPHDRVRSWLNIYDPMDVVTMGRGIGTEYPAALDLAVNVSWDHDIEAYMAHPIVAEAIGHALPEPAAEASSGPPPDVPARPIGREWYPLLLTFGYSAHVSRSYLGREWKTHLQLARARRELAERTLAMIDVGLSAMAEREDQATAAGRHAASKIETNRVPLRADLLDRPANLITAAWKDSELIPLLVGLRLSPLVPPYDMDIEDERLADALAGLVRQIRKPDHELSGDAEEIVTAVVASIDEAKGVVVEGVSWKVAALVGAGVVVLAATGVRLLAAIPAGLAGGAAMVGGLAAFGPGGMAGGIATVATLSGLGGVLAGSALVLGVASPTRLEANTTDLAEAVAAVLAGSLDHLRGVVAGLLSVVGAESRLKLTSNSIEVLRFLDLAHSRALREHELHEAIAPGRPGTKQWLAKVELLDRALKWLTTNGPAQELPVTDWNAMRKELDD